MLAVIKHEKVYGYELAMKLEKQGLDVSEGSIYPVLLRLQKEGLIKGEIKASPSGPNRKYYSITEDGEKALENFEENWKKLKVPVDSILNDRSANR
ncbi:PadR family transcriptional regulator PadR [Saliterribacillus persicus]|uniref:PadR family transcriptional regulator PadR n=2 Tax=Saliterribacillus persicus TaxID=930114 RepID=A0A368Y3L8_9BACI|nr:PadR family transcriptional regulator PadR [Saliterribacillus persicus]